MAEIKCTQGEQTDLKLSLSHLTQTKTIIDD